MTYQENKTKVWVQIATPVLIAVLVGTSAPWWCRGISSEQAQGATTDKSVQDKITSAVTTGPSVKKEAGTSPARGAESSQDRQSVSGKEVTGTFSSQGREFKFQALGGNMLQVEFLNGEGYVSGSAYISGDAAIFKPKEYEGCEIKIKFLPNLSIQVRQDDSGGDCGEEDTEGTYHKVDSSQPDFN